MGTSSKPDAISTRRVPSHGRARPSSDQPPGCLHRRQRFDGRISPESACECHVTAPHDGPWQLALRRGFAALRPRDQSPARACRENAACYAHAYITRRFGVFSVRSLLVVWVSSSLATLGYAYADLSLT